MPNRYRIIVIAICGLICSAASLPPDKRAQPEAQKSEQQADRRQSATDLGSGIGKSPEKTEDYNPPCDPGHDDRNSDLCAQWKAADAAKESADWTRRTFFLGIVGTAVGFMTLIAAGAAAYYAKIAAAATTNAVTVAREIGEAQVRAYLTIKTVRVCIDAKNRLGVGVSVDNSGQSPALYAHFVCEAAGGAYPPVGNYTTQSIWMMPSPLGDIPAGAKGSEAIPPLFTAYTP